MNTLPKMGHNNPPDRIEEIQAAYDAIFSEVANWLDGSPVGTEPQMVEVDKLLALVKEAEKEAVAAKEDEYRPHKAACDAVVARWKPFLDDLGLQKKGLAAAVDGFKRKLAEARDAERRAKEAEAREAMRKAEAAATTARAADLDGQREAAAAIEAARVAQQAVKDVAGVKGLRTYTIRTVDDPLIFGRWVWNNDRPAFEAFLQTYLDKMTGIPPAGCGATERKEKRAV